MDAFGEKYPEIRARQEEDLKKVGGMSVLSCQCQCQCRAPVHSAPQVYSRLDPAIPMVCVCGNHDVGNSPTTQSIQR